MTVGVGFLCRDGIVLCADRQITSSSGFKFQEHKISAWYDPSLGYTMVFTYSGIQDESEIMFRRVHEAIDRCGNNQIDHLVARSVLEQVFKDGYESDYSDGFESLVGFRFDHADPMWLFKTRNRSVVDAGAEHIGCGDSSALRYLCDFLFDGAFSIGEAAVFGTYIVSVANRYVDGCSGGPDYLILPQAGLMTEGTGGPYPNAIERFLHCEKEIGAALRELLLSGGTKRLIAQK